jgi:hypothetical protein
MKRPSGLAAVTQFAVLNAGMASTMKRTMTVNLTATMMLLNRADSRMPTTSRLVMAMITATADRLTMAPVADHVRLAES